MPEGTHTWVRNPETGGVWECPNVALEAYLARGWELADEPVDPDVTSTAPVPEADLYDPSQHTADEVNEYLAGLEDSPEEHSRVVALEIAGKNRKSVVGSSDETSKE